MSAALAGKRIVNTRAVAQAAALDALLRDAGAQPVAFPCIAVRPPDDPAAVDDALIALAGGRFAWLALTSANTVYALAERLRGLKLVFQDGVFRCACIGPGTAEAAREQLGLTSINLPEAHIAESLAAHIPVVPGDAVLLPESAIARPALAKELTARGAVVTTIAAYTIEQGTGGADLPSMLAVGEIDALTFTSSSTVANFAARLAGAPGALNRARLLPAACIGPKTAATAAEHSFTRVETAAGYTLPGLIAALEVALTAPIHPSGHDA